LVFTLLAFPGSVEVLLIDDAGSDPRIADIFSDFQQKTKWPTRIFRLRKRGHYTGVFNLALAKCEGERLFFLSNDMQVTPSFLTAQLGVLGLSDDIAAVRGTSQYTDSFPHHKVVPPFPSRGYDDILDFSRYVFEYHALAYEEDRLFSGDAVLMRRSVLSRLGGFDPRFFGYYSDFDYGLRAQKAGFRLVCAKGAWLHHEGAGHIKDESVREDKSLDSVSARRNELIQADYLLFREKWDPTLPPGHRGVRFDFAHMRSTGTPVFVPFSELAHDEL
jgi:GT2 family glycosyltransferase